MKYLYAIVHKEGDGPYGLTFPNLPGCFAAADEAEDLVPAAAEALALWFEDAALIDPAPLEQVRAMYASDLTDGAFIMAVPWNHPAELIVPL